MEDENLVVSVEIDQKKQKVLKAGEEAEKYSILLGVEFDKG